MKTSQLIDALAADQAPKGMTLRIRFWLALSLGAIASACLFLAIAGPRSNFVVSLQSVRFDLKFVDTLALTLPAALLCWRLLRPDARIGGFYVAFLTPVLLLALGVVGELIFVPPDLWGTRLIGTNSVHCLTVIPLLSAGRSAAKSAPRGGAGRPGRGRDRGDLLCSQLPGRFTAFRGELVSAGDIDRCRCRRFCRRTVAAMVSGASSGLIL
jgi:hypothetical protein